MFPHLNKNKMQILTKIYMTVSYNTYLFRLSSQDFSFCSPIYPVNPSLLS